eukprot:1001960-Amphidinium_carterae.1
MLRMMVDTVLSELPLQQRQEWTHATLKLFQEAHQVTRQAALTPLTLGTEASPQGAMAHRTHSAAWIWRSTTQWHKADLSAAVHHRPPAGNTVAFETIT